MTETNAVHAVEVVLGSPVAAEYSENALKVRRNLILSSLIAIIVEIGSVTLNPNSTIFGLQFIGLTDSLMRLGLAVLTLYLLLHFTWYALDVFSEWRLRVTGTKLSFVTTARLGSEDGDYPNDPRQSTLYSWWTEEARKIGDIKEKIQTFEKKWEQSQTAINLLKDDSPMGRNLHNVLTSLSQVQQAVFKLRTSVENVSKTIESQRIPVSLNRFDKWFRFFLKSQNLRWLIIDTLAPILVGIFAITMLVLKLWC